MAFLLFVIGVPFVCGVGSGRRWRERGLGESEVIEGWGRWRDSEEIKEGDRVYAVSF